MKMITAVVQPFRADEVVRALETAGFSEIEITECCGYGRQKGLPEINAGPDNRDFLIPKVMLKLVVEPECIDAVTGAIVASARTGNIGDGKIFIETVEDCISLEMRRFGDQTAA